MTAQPRDIVLTTVNARYWHSSFGLRYLMANLGELQERAIMLEFALTQRPADIAEAILAYEPRIVGIGVYIWNVTAATELAAILKSVRPDLVVVIGGPEVSHEVDEQPIARIADCVIAGEGDRAFAEVCHTALAGTPVPARVLHAPLPDLQTLRFPYPLYTDEDIRHRMIYVEASRGCPFRCEFCLSSLDEEVRRFPLPALLEQLDGLFTRGARLFKFVDRTFNLHIGTGRAILEFFLARCVPGLFLHFEMVPDRLPPALRELIMKFPDGALQFEIGIQTFDREVAARIQRRQDYDVTEDNIRWLRAHTGVHIHADLIFGLPGETLESFAAGFDRLVGLGPQEIQVNALKRLRGTPIARHAGTWDMKYNASPPYELLCSRSMDYEMLQRLKRFARYWDRIANSGHFVTTTPLLWAGGTSPFAGFLALCDWLHAERRCMPDSSLDRLAAALFTYLTEHRGLPGATVAVPMHADRQRAGLQEVVAFLRPFVAARPSVPGQRRQRAIQRQQRHRGDGDNPSGAHPHKDPGA